MFWCRDIRGGQGERAVFKALLKYLVKQNINLATRLIKLVPEYGRWDDLLVLEDSAVWQDVLELISAQFYADIKYMYLYNEGDVEAGRKVSLLAKWLPSINASSNNTKRLGRKISSYLGRNEKRYRTALTKLRAHLRIVEQSMCAREWSMIDYSKVPSRAAFMYRNAFKKQDSARYQEYLNTVQEGKAKINAGTLYPYEIVERYFYSSAEDQTIDLLWQALPNYIEGKEFNGLVVADVSGSMSVYSRRPLAVSISLAIYIAERNSAEVWKNKFLTFSNKPTLQSIVGSTIGQKVTNLNKADWDMNTDLIAVFKAVLSAGVDNNIPAEDMPKKLIIVSDMQFDQACRSNKRTNFEQIQKLYKRAGYEMPQLVFWNVNSHSNVPIKAHDTGTCLVSGCSPTTLKTVLTKDISPIAIMVETVYNERYDPVGQEFK